MKPTALYLSLAAGLFTLALLSACHSLHKNKPLRPNPVLPPKAANPAPLPGPAAIRR